MANMLDYALMYAKMGLRVFPVQEREKKPLPGSNGFKDAVCDEATIRRWWENNPNYNIGIACGEMSDGSFLTVIDIDNDTTKGKSGGESLSQWEKENNCKLPKTLTSKTGSGGFHYLYKTDKPFKNSTNLISCVDVRGEGGYIVAPPSIHPNGNTYQWVGENKPKGEDIASADSTVTLLLSAKKHKERTSKSKDKAKLPLQQNDVTSLGQSITEGQRNDTLFRLGCSLQAKGYSDSLIYQQLQNENVCRCSPPLPLEEIETIYKSVLTYPKKLAKYVECVDDFEEYTEKLSKKYPFIIASSNEKTGKVTYRVSTPRLAEYIQKKLNYFISDTKGNHPTIYFYNDSGIYNIYSDDQFKGEIIKPVQAFDKEYDLDYATPFVFNDTFKLLLADSSPGRRVAPSAFNSDENIINFQNGILHLDTMELTPHSPDILSTIQIPCNWETEEKALSCPIFDNYLKTLANADEEVIRFLWQYIGVTISNIAGFITKSALFLYGAGNTGKSQFLELLSRLVGKSNFASTDLKGLEEKFGTYCILHKRLAGSPDMSFAKVAEMQIFKKLTGGDDLDFEQKGKDKINDKYRGALLFCGNEMPKFGGDKGDHVYSRMIIIKCTNAIPEEKQDKKLIDKMYAEREAIIYHAVQALQEFIINGYRFNIPKCCDIETKKYKLENDNVLRFLEECTVLRTNKPSYTDVFTCANMYRAYQAWSDEEGEIYKCSLSDFIRTACRYYGFEDREAIKTSPQRGKRFYWFTLNRSHYHLCGFKDLE
ncbi:MAG: hypothetical protein HFE79_10000 [Ruminiclostridium sp.]|nr:hypothetical protein [Ruminiclostridium sp.]